MAASCRLQSASYAHFLLPCSTMSKWIQFQSHFQSIYFPKNSNSFIYFIVFIGFIWWVNQSITDPRDTKKKWKHTLTHTHTHTHTHTNKYRPKLLVAGLHHFSSGFPSLPLFSSASPCNRFSAKSWNGRRLFPVHDFPTLYYYDFILFFLVSFFFFFFFIIVECFIFIHSLSLCYNSSLSLSPWISFVSRLSFILFPSSTFQTFLCVVEVFLLWCALPGCVYSRYFAPSFRVCCIRICLIFGGIFLASFEDNFPTFRRRTKMNEKETANGAISNSENKCGMSVARRRAPGTFSSFNNWKRIWIYYLNRLKLSASTTALFFFSFSFFLALAVKFLWKVNFDKGINQIKKKMWSLWWFRCEPSWQDEAEPALHNFYFWWLQPYYSNRRYFFSPVVVKKKNWSLFFPSFFPPFVL